MILSINYSDKKFQKKQRINSWTAKKIGKVDKVIEYSPSDIDSVFFEENKDILNQKRGGGNWLWKPYIILKALSKLEDGDYLIYVDSGVVFKNNIKGLINKLSNSNNDLMLFELPLVELQWTRKEVFDYFGVNNNKFLYSNQIMGTIVVMKKTSKSVKFVKDWLDACRIKKILLLPELNEIQNEHYISHREDQSLLSVIAKINNVTAYSDPTDYGKFPSQYLTKDRFFYSKKYKKDYLISKTYFLHSRKSNTIVYFIKFMIKSLLKKLNLMKM